MNVFVSKLLYDDAQPYIEAFTLQKDRLNIVTTEKHSMARILSIHCPDYVQFLSVLASDNTKRQQDNIGCESNVTLQRKSLACYPHARLLKNSFSIERSISNNLLNTPFQLSGKLGYYTFDTSILDIQQNDFDKAYDSVQIAVAAAEHVVESDDPALALCETVGHFADKSLTGGGALFNHAAIAAQYILDKIDDREFVAILDLDANHASGTQGIFYNVRNPVVVSIHTETSYPFWTGKKNEHGIGMGHGRTINKVVPDYSIGSMYYNALDKAIDTIKDLSCKYIVVSLGLNVLADNADGLLVLTADDMRKIGEKLANLLDDDIKIVIVTEGISNLETAPKALIEFLTPFIDYCYYDKCLGFSD